MSAADEAAAWRLTTPHNLIYLRLNMPLTHTSSTGPNNISSSCDYYPTLAPCHSCRPAIADVGHALCATLAAA